MSVRNIKIVTTIGISGTLETNVSTLGELKPLLRQREINYDGMKLLVGETRNELSVNDAALPEGDFKLYLVPTKTKSGVDLDKMEKAIERIEDKIDEIFNILIDRDETSSTSYDLATTAKPAITFEDQQDLEDIRKLARGESWD